MAETTNNYEDENPIEKKRPFDKTRAVAEYLGYHYFKPETTGREVIKKGREKYNTLLQKILFLKDIPYEELKRIQRPLELIKLLGKGAGDIWGRSFAAVSRVGMGVLTSPAYIYHSVKKIPKNIKSILWDNPTDESKTTWEKWKSIAGSAWNLVTDPIKDPSKVFVDNRKRDAQDLWQGGKEMITGVGKYVKNTLGILRKPKNASDVSMAKEDTAQQDFNIAMQNVNQQLDEAIESNTGNRIEDDYNAGERAQEMEEDEMVPNNVIHANFARGRNGQQAANDNQEQQRRNAA